MATKPMLSSELLESQSALELPERDMLALVTLVALNGVITTIEVEDVNVGAQVCAQALTSGSFLSCEVTQR
jgi:hypothetical protein